MSLEGTFVGPFHLVRQIGAGAMGEVHEAVHLGDGRRAAVKLSRFTGRTALVAHAFTAELAALARLEHPNIVAVYDWGSLPDGAGGWLAMEWSELGSLRTHPVDDWDGLRSVLDDLLAGLAHAHAHGIVHRDLKPDNVLVFSQPGRFRLADFGLAHGAGTLDGDALTSPAAGTPLYMAPEQFAGRWRELGPWTDLYALGCMAFELCTGRPPFWGESVWEVARAHESAARPRLRPRFEVPEGFGDWVAALMRIAWAERPQRAVIARHALALLPAPTRRAASAPRDEPRVDAFETTRWDLSSTTLGSTWSAGELVEPTAIGAPTSSEPSPPPLECPGIPERWSASSATPALRTGLAMSLVPHRTPPLVGHELAREAALRVLREVADQAVPQVLCIHAARSSEAAAFSSWLASQVHAETACHVLHLPFRSGQRAQALASNLRRMFRAEGLHGERLFEQIARALPVWTGADPELARALAAALDGASATSTWEAEPLHGLLFTVLERASRSQPLVVLVDELERSHDHMLVLEQLIALRRNAVLLVVAETPDTTALRHPELEGLLERARAASVLLEPLSRDDAERLVESALHLEPKLRARLTSLAADDPSLALQLVRMGVRHAVLSPSPEGHVLAQELRLPSRFEELQALRFRLLRRESPSAAKLLALTAAADEPLRHDTLSRLAALTGLDASPSTLEALLKSELSSASRGSIDFDSEPTRAVLARLADDADVDRLLETVGASTPADKLRRGRLLLLRGRVREGASSILETLEDDEHAAWVASSALAEVEAVLGQLADDAPERARFEARRWAQAFDAERAPASQELEEALRAPMWRTCPAGELELATLLARTWLREAPVGSGRGRVREHRPARRARGRPEEPGEGARALGARRRPPRRRSRARGAARPASHRDLAARLASHRRRASRLARGAAPREPR